MEVLIHLLIEALQAKATCTGTVLKEAVCEKCGLAYENEMTRSVTKKGFESVKSLTKKADAELDRVLAESCDPHPCPGCGTYQPDMIASRKKRWHWYLFVAAAVTLPVLLVLLASEAVEPNQVCWLLAGVSGALLLGHAAVDLRNPNRTDLAVLSEE